MFFSGSVFVGHGCFLS